MPSNRRKCTFNAQLRAKYPYIESTSSESDVKCNKCRSRFSIAASGNADIARHLRTSKHIAAVNAIYASQNIDKHFQSLGSQTAAMEGVWAFHTVNANHSFKTTDCETKIFTKCFKIQNFSCSRTKCEAIITGVFAPYSERMLREDLKKCTYVSIYTDASNHGSTKLIPTLVRYFIPTVGISVKVLNVTSVGGETSEILPNLIRSVAREYEIEAKIVAFCADNAKVNFGGITRGGQNNVLSRLKVWFPYIIGIGCTAHIIHNALKHACDVFPFDVEYIIVKIYAHFYLYSVRTEALKSFCEEADVEYSKLLGYAKTRFLALGPAINRVIKLFDALKLYFLGLKKGEKALKEFFMAKDSKFWLIFIQEQAEIFAETVLRIESDDKTAIEILKYLNELEETLKSREQDEFLSPIAAETKQILIDDEYDADFFAAICKDFFDDARSYLNSWTRPLKELKVFEWVMLTKTPTWKEIETVMLKLQIIDLYDANKNAKSVHNQYRHIKNYCTVEKIDEWRADKVSVPNRWLEVFTYLDNENFEYFEISKLIEYVLCLPGTSSSVERVFSAVMKTWTTDKSQLQTKTLKAILMVKCNLKYSCLEFYTHIKSNPELQRQIAARDKYFLNISSDPKIQTVNDSHVTDSDAEDFDEE